MAGKSSISTAELWARLFKVPSVGTFLNEQSGDELPAFSDYIARLADEAGMKHEAVIARAGIERSYGHSGTRKPSRDTVIKLAFGFGCECDGAQQLLKVAGAGALHPKVKRDAVIAYCLHNGLSLVDAQGLLCEYDLPLLGGDKHG